MKPRGKILVIRGGAIGDFILTLPAIAALRQQFPQTHLEVLGYPHIVQLAVAAGLVDRVQPIEARALAEFFARHGTLSEDLVDYFSEFDIIVSYLYDPDEIFRTNIARCSPAQFIAGPHRPNESEKLHATKVYLRPLEHLAIFEADPVPRLNLTVDGRADLPVGPDAQQRVPTIALHPGSGSEKKNWPEENWNRLLEQLLNSTPFHLLLVGGEAEGERLQRLAAHLLTRSTDTLSFNPNGGEGRGEEALRLRGKRPLVSGSNPLTPLGRSEGEKSTTRHESILVRDRVQIAQSLPLVDLARALQGCAAFIGHDSGISHLAAALGLPGIVLWGDTAEAIWRPPHQRIVILKGGSGLKGIRVEQVFDQLNQLLTTTRS